MVMNIRMDMLQDCLAEQLVPRVLSHQVSVWVVCYLCGAGMNIC
jgi:hypothetical protein